MLPAAIVTLAAAACGSGSELGPPDSPYGHLRAVINASGSSTVEPVTSRAGELFEDWAWGVAVNVDGPGTGDGFKLFCTGETDLSNASRAIKEPEAAECAAAGVDYVELKIAYDGLTVMTHPANDAVDCLSFADLYALLGGESQGFRRWSDGSELAAALGSVVAPFPAETLEVSAPGTESGTYDTFVELVLEPIAEERGHEDRPIRTDIAGQAQDNVIVQGIAGSRSSLGWVGFAFAQENAEAIKELSVAEEPGGSCVAPTVATIADGSYPISRALFVYVNTDRMVSNPALVPFVDFYLTEAYTDAVTLAFGRSGYVELPEAELAEVRARWAAAVAEAAPA